MLGKDVIGPALEKLKAKHPSVGDVRGLGVFWAVELIADATTREPAPPATVAAVVAAVAAARDLAKARWW